jgi:hypothetical protein
MHLRKNRGAQNRGPFAFLGLVFLIFSPIIFLTIAGRPAGIPEVAGGTVRALRLAIHFVLHLDNGWADSWVPMTEALKVLAGPHANQLYEYLFFKQSLRFQYPPMSLLPIEFLSRFGLAGIRSLNMLNIGVFCLNAAFMGLLAGLLFVERPIVEASERFSSSLKLRRAAVICLAVLSSAVFYPLLRAVNLGQIQIWIDAIFTLAIIFWHVGKRTLAGICIGLACAIKPQFALLLLWGFLWAEYGFAFGGTVCLAALCLLSISLYGLHDHLAYFDVLSFLSKHGESFFANNSINGILENYFSADNVYSWNGSRFAPYIPVVFFGTVTASLLSLAAIVFSPIFLRSGKRANVESLAFAAIFTVVGSPVAWEHHYGILLPIYLIALKNVLSGWKERRSIALLAVLWISWVLVANFIPQTLLLAYSPLRFLVATQFLGALLLLIPLLSNTKVATPADLQGAKIQRLRSLRGASL